MSLSECDPKLPRGGRQTVDAATAAEIELVDTDSSVFVIAPER